MIPIYEQGDGRGIGHSQRSFLEKFDQIIMQHSVEGRAKKFCFMLYNFKDFHIKEIIKDIGFFAEMDRLTGHHISLFYLHSDASQKSVEKYNVAVKNLLGDSVELNLPCLVFFEWSGEYICNISVVYLENPNLIHGFREIEREVSNYICDHQGDEANEKGVLSKVYTGGRFFTLETVRGFIRELVSLGF